MGKEEHRFYFSSTYSTHNKSQAVFTVNLPFPLDFIGKWKCSILDVFIKINKPELNLCYILANFCDTSLVEETKQLPILKKLYLKPSESYYSFLHPLYIPLKQTRLSNFTLTFLDSNLQNIYLDSSFLIECNIHFYKHGR